MNDMPTQHDFFYCCAARFYCANVKSELVLCVAYAWPLRLSDVKTMTDRAVSLR